MATCEAFQGAARRGLMAALFCATALSGAARAEDSHSIGLAITEWHLSGTFTADGKEECPNGINPDNRDNFKAQFKNDADRQANITKYADIERWNRGPHGESANYSPELVHDPLPFGEAQSKVSDGLNLDGTSDGHATDTTCDHGKFVSPTGQSGIDNQLYRVFACVRGTRTGGFYDAFFNGEIRTKQIDRWLIEITGVDDPANDDHVVVTIAKGLDKLVQDPSGKFVPGLSQRIDYGVPDYIQRTTGKIVNHVLITEPFPILRLPSTGINEVGERRFQGARLRLELSADGAKGLLAGYHDEGRFYRWYAKTIGQHGVADGVASASIYASLLRNADGFKDPKTGQCTAISAAYNFDAVRAFIVHEKPSPQAAAPTETKLAKAGEAGPAN